jgi:hypothetical protein
VTVIILQAQERHMGELLHDLRVRLPNHIFFVSIPAVCAHSNTYTRWRRKVALPFLFHFLQIFSVFSEKSFLRFCMGKFKKNEAKYFSLSLSPGFLSFLRDFFSSFLLHLAHIHACATHGMRPQRIVGLIPTLVCIHPTTRTAIP